MNHNERQHSRNITTGIATAESKPVKVSILGKELQMACTEGSEDNLHRAAHYVDQSMNTFRKKNKSLSVEKIAIVTAINIANDLLNGNLNPESENDGLSQKLQSLSARIDTVLEEDY